MAISGVKNVAMKAGRGLAKARNEGATYAAGGVVGRPAMPAQANPRSALGGAGAKGPVTQPVMPPTAMKKGGKIAAPKGKADLPPWMMKKGMKKGGKC